MASAGFYISTIDGWVIALVLVCMSNIIKHDGMAHIVI